MGTTLYIEGTDRALTIAEAAAVADGPGWWLRFAEVPSREAADDLRNLYLEIDAPVEEHEPGRWFFHELEGLAVRSTAGEELGRIVEIYRAGGAEVFVVRGPRGEIDVPGVRGIVTDLAPDRGEMIVDMDALDMDARPVDDEDYVRPRDRRPKKQPKPKGPAQPPKGTGPVRKPVEPAASKAGRRDAASPRTPGAPKPASKPAPEPVAPPSAPDPVAPPPAPDPVAPPPAPDPSPDDA